MNDAPFSICMENHLTLRLFYWKYSALSLLAGLFVLCPCDEIKDKISERKVCSSPCSVKNGRGDVIYRHGCRITGSSCGEGEANAFSVFSLVQLVAAQRSVVLRFVMQRGRGGRDMGTIPSLSLCSLLRKAFTSVQSLFYLMPPSSSSSSCSVPPPHLPISAQLISDA